MRKIAYICLSVILLKPLVCIATFPLNCTHTHTHAHTYTCILVCKHIGRRCRSFYAFACSTFKFYIEYKHICKFRARIVLDWHGWCTLTHFATDMHVYIFSFARMYLLWLEVISNSWLRLWNCCKHFYVYTYFECFLDFRMC